MKKVYKNFLYIILFASILLISMWLATEDNKRLKIHANHPYTNNPIIELI